MKRGIFVLFAALIILCLNPVFSDENQTQNQTEVSSGVITGIIPSDFPALVPMVFVAELNSSSNYTYYWEFGDGGNEITTKGTIIHAYPDTGYYELKLRISNSTYQETKIFGINANSPKDYVNATIANYLERLRKSRLQLNSTSDFLKNTIEQELDFSGIESEIRTQEMNYVRASNDNDYTNIMKALVSLKIPLMINLSRVIKPIGFLLDEKQIDNQMLVELGAGFDSKDYSKEISKWILDNLEVAVESKTYSVYFSDKTENKYSDVIFALKPKQEINKIYFIVNGNPEKIVFNGDFEMQNMGSATGMLLSDLNEEKKIEFIYPDKINPLNIPVVISPDFSELPAGILITCNNNDVCEGKEDYKNCPNDCSKSWGLTIFWLFILLIIFLIVYIILQEWYKRHYESSLFSNRNELFNLVNFMNNSENQGLKKSIIFENLKKLGWSKEQMTYSWNKLHGYRTGMWEIPVFKWLENKQVQTELDKRQGSMRRNIYPD